MAETGLNHQAVKTGNKTLVLRKLHEEGPMSRTDLAKSCGLSKMTITNRIQELLLSGDIRETRETDATGVSSEGTGVPGSEAARAGRRPVLLQTVPDARHAVSLYISRDRIEAAVFNWRLEEKASTSEPFPPKDTASGFKQRLLCCMDRVLLESGLSPPSLSGIGVAMIGPLDYQNGILLNPPNFHDLHELPIRGWLEEAYGVPVFVDNDMNASAVAELLFGHGRGLRSFLYVGVTNGIGAGIVQDGRLFRGFAGFAGELGHTTISFDGPVCNCGNSGCLELFASIPAMVDAIQASDTAYAQDHGMETGGKARSRAPRHRSWTDIAEAERRGDSHTHAVLTSCCQYLGAGLVNAINLFDPQAVFLGHDLALAGDSLLTAILPEVHRRVLAQQHRNIPIAFSVFGHRSPIHGGAALVFDALLHDPLD